MRAALISGVLAIAAVANATPGQDLERARAEFRAGHFKEAQDKYNSLLYPEIKLANADDLVDAYVSLGVCLVDSGDNDRAKREFEKALLIDPNHQIDPTVVTNKVAIRLFDDTKTDITTRAEREAAQRQKAEDAERIRKLMESTVVLEPHPYYLNFIPFGVGQYQNNQNGKGVFFTASEVVTLGTSFGIWAYIANRYGINNQHLHIDNNEAENVFLAEVIGVGAGTVFWGLAVYGVVDSLMNYQPRKIRKADPSLLKDLEKPKPAPKKTSFHIAPMVTPTGAGIGLSWEN